MTALLRSAVLAAAVLLFGASAGAQQKPYEPQIGQAGKDVIWVPTPDEVVERMLRMAQVTKDDYVVDLGAGDGKIAIMAAKKFGARSMGIEYNPEMARYAQSNVVKAGVTERAKILQGDIFATDFTSATVVTMYLLPGLNMKLRPQLLQMKPGTRIVSHSFTMEDWQPDESSTMDGRRAYFWIVPANVMGAWTLEFAGEKRELSLEQRFQKIDGSIAYGTTQAGLREPALKGANIAFSFVDQASVRRDFGGRIASGRMEGTFRADNGTEGRWTATKK